MWTQPNPRCLTPGLREWPVLLSVVSRAGCSSQKPSLVLMKAMWWGRAMPCCVWAACAADTRDCWVGRCCLPLLFSRLRGGMAGTLPPTRQCWAAPAGPRPAEGTQAVWSTLCNLGLPQGTAVLHYGLQIRREEAFLLEEKPSFKAW